MDRATAAAAEVARINTYFPLLPRMGLGWAARRPWEDTTIAVNAHLTTLTAALLRELALGGGEWVVCAANEHTTDPGVVELLRQQGIQVYTGRDNNHRHRATLDAEPELIVDVGYELIRTLMDQRADQATSVRAGIEITRTGINRLRRRPPPFGVMNINDGALKHNVENRHGVGEGLWPAVTRITGMHLSGRKALVIGYGPTGQGLAHYARGLGASVEVIEVDPIRRLVALYDGFPCPTLEEGLERADIAVTVTGTSGALPLERLEAVESDLILVSAGHGSDEIDVKGLRGAAVEGDELGPHCVRYRLRSDGPWLSVLGKGNPLNIVLNAGSPEPVLLHFALLGHTLEHLANTRITPGEHLVPKLLESQVAELAFKARR